MSLFPTAKANLRLVKNYIPGKPLEELEREHGIRNAIKMASNENALGASPKAILAMRKALSRVHRYPEGGCYYLRQKLSRLLHLKPEQFVFGNGSDEILVMAVRAFVGLGDEVIIADPTFLIYEIASSAENGRVIKVPMKQFKYDLEGMAAKINERTKLIFIANPDNPVGTYIETKRLSAFLEKVPSHVVVVLDEAYCEFAQSQRDYPNALNYLKQFQNLIVTRTFSKAYGLAGLRIGYSMSSASLAYTLNKVREPFNVNVLAQVAAVAALDDKVFLKKSIQTVEKGRRYLQDQLTQMDLSFVDTYTNFILFDLKRDAKVVYEKLLKAGIIVRPMATWGLDTYLRVTIGTMSDNRRFIRKLKKILV